MALKRDLLSLGDESEYDSDDGRNEKRIKATKRSFASCVGNAVMATALNKALEPLLRKVVYEETLGAVTKTLKKSPSLRIQAPQPSTLKLIFKNGPSHPIFTGSKLLDPDNNPLELLLTDGAAAAAATPTLLSPPVRVEIVPLYGDFSPGEDAMWTVENFNKSVAREREGRRPLLAGVLNVTVREGIGSVGDVEFTDNSSWVRSRRFRIGARVAPGSGPVGVRILEAVTEAFVVKEHRGECYKKHHPPSLEDEVWRLEKIRKEGPFHEKMRLAGINTVQDFLKMYVVDSSTLKTILRNSGMADKKLEAVTAHARECKIMGNKTYLYRGPCYWVVVNPICQVVEAMRVMDGQIYSGPELQAITSHGFVEKLAGEAYANWESLEEDTPLLIGGNATTGYPYRDYYDAGHSDDAGCGYWPYSGC